MKNVVLFIFLIPCSLSAQVIINEIAPNNRYFFDEDSIYPDWIEIMNIDVYNIDLAQFSISDNSTNVTKWLFPDTVLYAGEKLIVFASDKNRRCFDCPDTGAYLHTNFKLSTGEKLILYSNAGELLDSVTIRDVYAGDVMVRIPDGGDWCLSNTPTPFAINDVVCYTDYAPAPEFITQPGNYPGGLNILLSGTDIYYTLDGDWPGLTGIPYDSGIAITSNTVVKMVVKKPGLLPSRTVSGTFLINAPTLLPIVSVSANACDMFAINPTCIGAYDTAEGWTVDNPQIPASVEYFTADHVQQFNKNIRFEVVGNSSIYFYDQHSLEFTVDEDFGDKDEFKYNIFEKSKPLDSLNAFRLRCNYDWGESLTRFHESVINEFAMPTYNIAPAFQHVASYINGVYWGHYTAREELDTYFLRNNYDVNTDSVVIIRSGAGLETWDVAEAGSIQEYNDLVTFFDTHDMTNPDDYNIALNLIDKYNWIDHFAFQSYINNVELAYNIRIFKSYDPDVKWKFIIWDATGSGIGFKSTSLGHTLTFAYLCEEINMMDDLMSNPEFKLDFINRYADLLNYYFTREKGDLIIDKNVAEIEAEIPYHRERWEPTNTISYTAIVNSYKNFYKYRAKYQRLDILDYFDLNNQVEITLNVSPPGAGFIKISTIVPDSLPWSGTYFDGAPVTVTAIPNPGFTFIGWDENAFISDTASITFTSNFTDTTSLTANFNGEAMGNPIQISELNYHSDSTADAGDWLELYNNSYLTINLSDYTIQNRFIFNKYTFPQNTVIPAYGYLVIAENKNKFQTIHPDVTNVIGDLGFDLKNDNDSIIIKNPAGRVIINCRYSDDFPWPETADGYGRTLEKNEMMIYPTLPSYWFAGCINGSPGSAYSPCNENPIIDEINYHSADLENAGDWFELINWDTTPIDLSGWTVKDKNGNSYKVPEGTILESEAYLVVFEDSGLFHAQFPSVTNAIGPLNFGFNNSGDVILLYDNNGALFQSVSFENETPYPLSPDGGGTTMQLINAADNLNDAFNWTESCPEGSPGAAFVTPCANSISDEAPISLISIRPNPATDIVTFTISELPGVGVLYVFDVTGKLVTTQRIESIATKVDVQTFNAGVYFVKMVFEDVQFTNSFVKN